MKRSGHVRCRSRGALVAALCAALACIPDVAGAQDDRDGFYAGLHLGVALPTVVTSARRYVSHPTRCDVLLYPPSVSPPADDPACSNNTPGTTANTFTLGAGPTAGFMVGYGTGRLRFEMEYLNASLGSAESPIGGTTSTALLSKTSEWSTEEPPLRMDGGLQGAPGVRQYVLRRSQRLALDAVRRRWHRLGGNGVELRPPVHPQT